MLHQQLQRFWELQKISNQMLTARNFNVKNISCSIHEIIQDIMLCGFQDMVMVMWENQTRRQGICFQQLEQHSHKYLDLHWTHPDFMKGYKQLGYKKQTDENVSSYEEEVYHHPQHTVLSSSRSTHKRVLFEDSSHSNTGLSLYNTLLNGPTIHKYLYYTILQFTTWQITFTAAANKIYHELKIHPKIEYCNKFCEENSHMTQ